MTTHLGEWIDECEKLDITITGKQAQEAIAKYKGVSVQQQTEARMPFSKNNFLNAIVNFIVVTNQVFLFIYFFPDF
jgi:large-conductance mechanosensitive channel